MARSLGGDYRQVLTGGGEAAIVAWSIFAPQIVMATASAALAAALAFFAWMSCHRRMRAVADTPTSRIASAAQGYVELSGILRPLPGRELRAPLSGEPCVWYRFRDARYNGSGWFLEETGDSETPFMIVDTSGTCTIQPQGAEMTGLEPAAWFNDQVGSRAWRLLERGDRRKTEWLLREGEEVHVLGNFTTRRDPDDQREVHQLGRPDDGRPFLIRLGVEGEALGRASYRRWAIFHVFVFLLALASLPHALGKPW